MLRLYLVSQLNKIKFSIIYWYTHIQLNKLFKIYQIYSIIFGCFYWLSQLNELESQWAFRKRQKYFHHNYRFSTWVKTKLQTAMHFRYAQQCWTSCKGPLNNLCFFLWKEPVHFSFTFAVWQYFCSSIFAVLYTF